MIAQGKHAGLEKAICQSMYHVHSSVLLCTVSDTEKYYFLRDSSSTCMLENEKYFINTTIIIVAQGLEALDVAGAKKRQTRGNLATYILNLLNQTRKKVDHMHL